MVNYSCPCHLLFKGLTALCVSDRAKDGDLCYKQMNWIDVWMNDATNKKELGVPAKLRFDSCNMEVNQAFFRQGDGMHNSAALLPEIINDDVKLLVYAGNADAMCNYMVRIPLIQYCLCASAYQLF